MENAVKLCVICLIFVSSVGADTYNPASKCPKAGTCFRQQIWEYGSNEGTRYLTDRQKALCRTCEKDEYSPGKVSCLYLGGSSTIWPFVDTFYSCYKCARGQVANAAGDACIYNVQDCPAGMFSVTTTVKGGSRTTGETWTYNPGICYDCRKGSYSNRGTVGDCTLCPPGTYAPNAGSASCLPCANNWGAGGYTC